MSAYSHLVSRKTQPRLIRRFLQLVFALLLIGGTPQLSHAAFPGTFNWVMGLDTTVPPARGPLPAVNVPFTDPVHGTTIQRITDDPNTWRRHEYSRRPAFNVDSTRIIMRSSGGFWHLYRLVNNQALYDQALPVMTEPNWHPTNPNLFRYFYEDGDDMKIHEYNIATRRSSVIADFAGRLPWNTASRVWTRWEGKPSTNGRIWCLMAEDSNLDTVGIFSYDIVADRIIGTLNMSTDPDHISTSPNGSYCLPAAGSPYGIRAYNLTFSRFTQLHNTTEHSDVALDAAGRDVLALANFDSGYIEMVDMANARRTRLVPLYQPQGSKYSVHISGLATDRPGHIVVSTYNTRANNAPGTYGALWGQDRLAVVELNANPKIYNVAYMRNADDGYWTEPQATVNKDLTRIIFASTWGTADDDATRSYMVTLDAPLDEAQLRRDIGRKMVHVRLYLQRTPLSAYKRPSDRNRLWRRYRSLWIALSRGLDAHAKYHANILALRFDGCGTRPDGNDYVKDCRYQRILHRNFLPIKNAINQLAQN